MKETRVKQKRDKRDTSYRLLRANRETGEILEMDYLETSKREAQTN